MDARRGLQLLLVGLGAVAATTGAATLSRGTAVVRSRPTPDPDVESEHRFLAAWWTALGPLLWSLAPGVERKGGAIRAVAATSVVGGAARLVAARQVGRPHPLYLVLAGVELALGPLLVGWHEVVRRRAEQR